MAQWWQDFISNPLGGIQDFISGLGSNPNVGYAPQYETPRIVGPQYLPTTSQSFRLPTTGVMTPSRAGAARQGVTPQTPVQSTLIPSNLEAAGRMGGANALPFMMAPQAPSYFGMSPEELMEYLLGGGGGGGVAPVDVSGYDPLLEDIAGREAALQARQAEQQAYLTSLFDAAEQRAAADREALAATIDAQLASDQARRAEEIALIRNDEAGRLATASEAREALGVTPGEDLSSQLAQNAVGGVGAAGSVAERDARILQNIREQQLTSEIGGLVPMEARFIGDLARGYEDRVSALASERANIMAQIAAAKANAPRGGGGPSVSDRLNVLQFVQQAFGPGEQPQLPGAGGYLQGLGQTIPQQVLPDLISIGDRILQTSRPSSLLPGEAAGPQELLSTLQATDPAIASLLQSYPGAAAIILDYVNQAQ